MSTTYRPGSSERWGYFPVICTLMVVGFLCIGFLPNTRHGVSSCFGVAVLAAGILVLVVIAGWRTSTSRVVLDESGIQWQGGGVAPGRLRWDEIQGLDYDRKARILIMGLTEKPSGRFLPLPFITKELYCALKERLGGGAPDVEGECLLK